MYTPSFWAHLINWDRVKAFFWQTGAQGLALLLSGITTDISNHTIIVPAWASVLVGLAIAQSTKALNNYLSNKQVPIQ